MTARTIDTLKTNMPLGVTGGTTVQDLHDAIDTFASRTAYSVKEFGAKGDGINDDTVALQDALNTGGPVFLPPGNYRTTATLMVTMTGTRMIGSGAFGQTRISPTSPTADVITVTAQQVTLEHFEVAPPQVQTGGFGIVFNPGCFHSTARAIRLSFCHNGVLINGATETRLYQIAFRYLTGNFGVHFVGSDSARSFRAILHDILADNPFPVDLGQTRGVWVANTAYTRGQVVERSGLIYQCTQSGTSSTSGPPTAIPPFFVDQTDGSAKWQLVCNSLAWIVQNSYAFSLSLSKIALINGVRGFYMTDSANVTGSYPVWMFGEDIETDHTYLTGIDLQRGEGVYITTGWQGSTLTAHGIHIGAAFRGEVSITNSRIMGCAVNGVRIENGPVDTLISNCQIGDNGNNGIEAAPGAKRFVVVGNRLGDLVGVAGTIQPYGIAIASGNSNEYIIVGNNTRGNVNGGIFDAGTGVNKVVANNL